MVIAVAERTIVVFSDLACPWARVAVHRLHAARAVAGMDHEVTFEHRWFPLELVNSRSTPRPVLDAEIPVVAGVAPECHWTTWTRMPHDYPVTMLPATEAVRAARMQGVDAAEELDLALREGLFGAARNISLLPEILEVARECDGVDADRLEDDMWSGRARPSLRDEVEQARREDVKGSPHLFFADGSEVHNPGIEMHWAGPREGGFPRVTKHDASIYDRLLERAAAVGTRRGGAMDETMVRDGAETHARATVAGDLKVAGSYLSREAMAQAGEVMKAMPGRLDGSEIGSVAGSGDGYVVEIRYRGDAGEVTVESTWSDIDGSPKITNLKVL